MKKSLKKRGQKFVKKFSRVSKRASVESKEHIKENVFARVSHILNIKLLIFEWVLLVVALIMLASAQAFWFGDSYAENAFVNGGTYTEATIGKVNSMNPIFAATDSEKVLSKLMFATLISNDYSGKPGMEIASSINPSDNGKVWTMRIRDNIKWSDGEPLTRDDVLFTLKLIQNPAVNSPYYANLSGVKITETEDGGIVFTLPSVYSDFMSVLNIPILPKHILGEVQPSSIVEHSFSMEPVTSGAFTLNATQNSNSSESTIYLSANPNYFRGKPMLSSFAVKTFETKQDIINAMNSGTATATAELSGLEANEVTAGQFIKKESGINWGTYIFFNTARGSFKNRDLRVAVRKGIDLTKIREAAPNTIAINYPIIDSQIVLKNLPAMPERNFDESASKIAGIAGENKLSIELATVRAGFLPAVGEKLAEELRGLGFEVNLSIYEENQEFLSNVISKRNYDILLYDIELGTDPDPLPYYHSTQISESGLNLSSYRNVIADDLLVGARGTMDKELRAKKYESFINYWSNDVPSIGLYQSNLTYIFNKNVRAFGDNVRLVTPLDRFIDVTSWAVNKGERNKTP